MEVFASLRSSFSLSEAFRLYLVSAGYLPATQISKPLARNLPNAAYTTFPKARVLEENGEPQVPPGAIHIVYNIRMRRDNYNPMDRDTYFGIPCPSSSYPRPMKYSFYLVSGNTREQTPFYTMSCPLESVQPAKMLTRFAYVASQLSLKVEMVCEYDAQTIRPFTSNVSQQDAERIIRGMCVNTVYPDYVAALRRLAHLHGPSLSDVCINSEDPFTLEDLEDLPREDIVRYGRELDGRKSCAAIENMVEYITKRLQNAKPIINPSDRTDIISQDDIQEIFNRMKQKDPDFVEPLMPYLYVGEPFTRGRYKFVNINAVVPTSDDIIESDLGVIPIEINGQPIPGSNELIDIIVDPKNLYKMLTVTRYDNDIFVELSINASFDMAIWMRLQSRQWEPMIAYYITQANRLINQ